MSIERNMGSVSLKANRFLGMQLVDRGLITLQQLESANARYLERRRDKTQTRLSLLKILCFEEQSLSEDALLSYQLDSFDIGALNLPAYKIDPAYMSEFSVQEMLATWTVPAESVCGVPFLSTAYYLSPFVREYWEERVGSDIVWNLSPLSDLELLFEQLESSVKEGA